MSHIQQKTAYTSPYKYLPKYSLSYVGIILQESYDVVDYRAIVYLIQTREFHMGRYNPSLYPQKVVKEVE